MNAVVIKVRVLGYAEPDVATRERRHVMGVAVIQRMVSRDNRNIVALRPAKSNKSKHVGSMGVNDIKFLLAKAPQFSPIGWIRDGVTLAPGGF